MLCTLAAIVILLPWLRTIPRLGPLPSLPWQVGVGAVLLVTATLGLYHRFGSSDSIASAPSAVRAGGAVPASGAFAKAVNASNDLTAPAAAPAAGSMGTAIASLEARLAKGGGTTADWELLAKSYEFLGRPADAGKARAKQLPPLPPRETDALPAVAAVVSGEISLAPSLKSKAASGATLFIVAKSVDSPGVPVAVYRANVDSWPVKFTLNDSQSMIAGRNLSSAGRVTIEARISQSGQPLPAAGDLQGSTGVINPSDHQDLKILIDRIIS